jgi:hypothetical protein
VAEVHARRLTEAQPESQKGRRLSRSLGQGCAWHRLLHSCSEVSDNRFLFFRSRRICRSHLF